MYVDDGPMICYDSKWQRPLKMLSPVSDWPLSAH